MNQNIGDMIMCPIDKGQTCDNYSWLSALLHLELAEIQKWKECL